MPFNTTSFGGVAKSPLVEPVFVQDYNLSTGVIPPVNNILILLSGSPFNLLAGGNLFLLSS